MPFTYDDFSASLDANYWTTVQGSPSTSGGVLVLTPGAAGVKQVKSTINLTGDFDIQADFVYTNTATDSWYFFMIVGAAASMPDGQDTNNYSYYMRVGRCYHTGGFIRNWYKGAGTGAPTLDGSVANTGTSSKFRLTRTGSTFKAYYDIGGGWVQVGAAAGISITSADVKIVLDAQSLESNPAPTATVDNVVVNAGFIAQNASMTLPAMSLSSMFITTPATPTNDADLILPGLTLASYITSGNTINTGINSPFILPAMTLSASFAPSFSVDLILPGLVMEARLAKQTVVECALILPAMTMFITMNVTRLINADLILPAMTLESTQAAIVDLTLPAMTITCHMTPVITINASLKLPALIISGTGTVTRVINATLTMTRTVLSSSLYVTPVINFDANLSRIRLLSSLTVGTGMTVSLAMPAMRISASFSAYNEINASIILPALKMVRAWAILR